MPNIVIRMSDEQHAKLEEHRAAFRLRSLNAAMLHLIDDYDNAYQRGVDGMELDTTARPTVKVDGPAGRTITVRPSIKQPARGPWSESAPLDAVSAPGPLGKVTFGPVTPKPGSRLKPMKGK